MFQIWPTKGRCSGYHNLQDHFDSHDDGQFLLGRGAHRVEDGPLFIRRLFIEEPDAADGNGHRMAGIDV